MEKSQSWVRQNSYVWLNYWLGVIKIYSSAYDPGLWEYSNPDLTAFAYDSRVS